MLLFIFYVLLALFIISYCLLYKTVKVRLGNPPFGVLFIAYKYSLLNCQKNFKFLESTPFSRKSHKLVKFCYYSKTANILEFAEGIIIGENGIFPSEDILREAQKAGLKIFSTPAVSHAIFIDFPLYLWFPLSKLFAVLIGYPRINRLTKVNNLCAYPSIEIYSMESITIAVPLIRQDEFVVPEAENVVFGKSYFGHEYRFNLSKFNPMQIYEKILSLHNLNTNKIMKSPKFHKRITKG